MQIAEEMRIEDDENLHHRSRFGGIEYWVAIARAGEGASHSSPRRERRALCLVCGRRALSDAGAAIKQLQRLAGHPTQSVVRHRVSSYQHTRNSNLLGTVRAEAGTVRLLASGHD